MKGKKIISLKNVKLFPKKAAQPNSILPKPPLHKKQPDADVIQTSAEALIKMADEGLASIEQDLNKTKKIPKIPLRKIAVKENPGMLNSKKENIQANFNLSFNNSFNTSINQSNGLSPQP